MSHAKLLAAAVLALPLVGCAAVLGTKAKDFDFTSTPAGASVSVDGNPVGTTPAKVHLSNLKEHTIVFHKEGYADATCVLTRGTGGGWVVLDVLSGLVPIIIDAATNNWSQTKGKGCDQQLVPVTNTTS